MPIRTVIWKVGAQPEPLTESSLAKEQLLETMIIAAASLDDSTERIVAYLSERLIPINVLCFQVFTHGTEQLLSRSWLLDPVRTQVSASTTPTGSSEPWNGEFYCSFGDGKARSW